VPPPDHGGGVIVSRDTLSLNLIDPDSEQPRKHFDETGLAELAQSMRENGLIVPVLVRPVGDRYVLVHGERRYRAAQALGWKTILAEVRDISPDEARWLALVENVQRADLSPIEEARAYQARLAEGITQETLAQRVGKSRTYIAQKLRLLGLPEDVQAAINAGQIKEGQARQLLRVKDASRQSELGARAVAEGWTVEQARQEVDKVLQPLHIRPWPEVQCLQPPLTDEERESMRASIEKLGVLNPIHVLPDGRIIDGHLRWELSGGQAAYIVHDISEKEAIELWASLNLRRQHLSSSQKAVMAVEWQELAFHEARIDAALDNFRAVLAAEFGPAWLTASYDDLWPMLFSELKGLGAKLDKAATLPEVLQIEDTAATIANNAAEFKLRMEREAGKILAQLDG
jgi:ParB family chromosome partitioning protein